MRQAAPPARRNADHAEADDQQCPGRRLGNARDDETLRRVIVGIDNARRLAERRSQGEIGIGERLLPAERVTRDKAQRRILDRPDRLLNRREPDGLVGVVAARDAEADLGKAADLARLSVRYRRAVVVGRERRTEIVEIPRILAVEARADRVKQIDAEGEQIERAGTGIGTQFDDRRELAAVQARSGDLDRPWRVDARRRNMNSGSRHRRSDKGKRGDTHRRLKPSKHFNFPRTLPNRRMAVRDERTRPNHPVASPDTGS